MKAIRVIVITGVVRVRRRVGKGRARIRMQRIQKTKRTAIMKLLNLTLLRPKLIKIITRALILELLKRKQTRI